MEIVEIRLYSSELICPCRRMIELDKKSFWLSWFRIEISSSGKCSEDWNYCKMLVLDQFNWEQTWCTLMSEINGLLANNSLLTCFHSKFLAHWKMKSCLAVNVIPEAQRHKLLMKNLRLVFKSCRAQHYMQYWRLERARSMCPRTRHCNFRCSVIE